jgi:hypothetical protein
MTRMSDKFVDIVARVEYIIYIVAYTVQHCSHPARPRALHCLPHEHQLYLRSSTQTRQANHGSSTMHGLSQITCFPLAPPLQTPTLSTTASTACHCLAAESAFSVRAKLAPLLWLPTCSAGGELVTLPPGVGGADPHHFSRRARLATWFVDLGMHVTLSYRA